MKELREVQKKLEDLYEKQRNNALDGHYSKEKLKGYHDCLNDLNIFVKQLNKKKKDE